MTADSYRVYVELPNGAKFRAQGNVSDVREDVERFYALSNGIPAPTYKPDTNGTTYINGTNGSGSGVTSEEPEQPSTLLDAPDRTTLDRLFSMDTNRTVSLRALPRGEKAEEDALVALIYGANKLANEQQVTGSRLMKAVQQSGLHQVDRIDRALSGAIGQFVTTAGFKKGRRYGLTNPGIRRAEDVLKEILG